LKNLKKIKLEKQTKILIGLAIGGAIGYLLFKPKASDTSVPVDELTTDAIDAQNNKVSKEVSTSTTTRTTTKPSIVEKINTALNTTKKPISTSTTTETTTMCNGELVTMPNGTLQCVQPYIITDQERLQNSFVPKEFRNELSSDAFGNLNAFMTPSDIYYIGNWAGGGWGGSSSGNRGGPSDYIYTSTGTIST
jgi:hypothetical protein